MPELIGKLGDVDFMDYGGGFVFFYPGVTNHDKGYYQMEYYEPDHKCPYDAELDGGATYRWEIEQFVNTQHGLILKSVFDEDVLPYPLSTYVEWFDKHLEGVASYSGLSVQELEDLFCSDDPMDRAQAYMELYHYFGPGELDQYPLYMTKVEAFDRYSEFMSPMDRKYRYAELFRKEQEPEDPEDPEDWKEEWRK